MPAKQVDRTGKLLCACRTSWPHLGVLNVCTTALCVVHQSATLKTSFCTSAKVFLHLNFFNHNKDTMPDAFVRVRRSLEKCYWTVP